MNVDTFAFAVIVLTAFLVGYVLGVEAAQEPRDEQ